MSKPFHRLHSKAELGLECYYVERRTLDDFRRGPLGPYFDGFAASLRENGYSHHHGTTILGTCCLFNVFLMDRGVTSIAKVSEGLIEPFLDEYLAGVRTTSLTYRPRVSAARPLKHLFAYLVAIKALVPVEPRRVLTAYSWILDPYLQHLRDAREVALVTLHRHARHVTAFLEALGEDVQRSRFLELPAEKVGGHITQYFKNNQDNVSSLAASLRTFLRYCALQHYISADFSGLIPPVRRYRHAGLPKGVEDSALERVLSLIDRSSPNGARDYAIILVLMAYGVRAISAAQLRLDDIDWKQSKIRFRAPKGGKEVVVPLLDAVGEALLQWLPNRQRHGPHREVFLGTKAPHGPLDSVTIGKVVRTYMEKAGIHAPGRGAHTLRHSWAIRALAHDTPIKAIADSLGHRYIDTTFIYAKADLKTLRDVAMPWPGKG
jgi:integrase